MARYLPIDDENDNKLEDRTEYNCYGNSDYIDFWYISRLNDRLRGDKYKKREDYENDDPVLYDLSEYIDEKDFINILHALFYLGLENPNTWNQ